MNHINLQCHRCHQIFSSSQRLQTHLTKKIPCQLIVIPKKKLTVSELKLNTIICPHCKKKFARPYNLERHIENNRCKQLKENNPIHFEKKMKLLEKQLTELKIECQNFQSKPKCQNTTNSISLPVSDPAVANTVDSFMKSSIHNGFFEGDVPHSENYVQLREKDYTLTGSYDNNSITDDTALPVEKMKQLEDRIATLEAQPRVSNQILQVISIGCTDNYLDMLTEKWGDFDKALEYIKDCALSSLTGDCKVIKG